MSLQNQVRLLRCTELVPVRRQGRHTALRAAALQPGLQQVLLPPLCTAGSVIERCIWARNNAQLCSSAQPVALLMRSDGRVQQGDASEAQLLVCYGTTASPARIGYRFVSLLALNALLHLCCLLKTALSCL